MEQARIELVLAVKKAFEVLGASQTQEIFERLYAMTRYEEKVA